MKTDDLMTLLAADAGAVQQPVSRVLLTWVVAGVLVSAALFVMMMGIRPDLGPALATWRFDLKLGIVALAAVIGFIDCRRIVRPDGGQSAIGSSWIVVFVLMAAVIAELATVSRTDWSALLVGTNATLCLLAIPALSLFPFAAVVWAARSGAPMSPSAAGATVGRLAASLAAVMYAFHCFDDSPLFVAIWYTLAIGGVSLIGAVVGQRLLRW